MKNPNFGLAPTPIDERDYQLGAITFLPKLEDIPKHFVVDDPIVKNQGNTDHCSAYMTTGESEAQEEIELNPEYSFAVSKQLSGDIKNWGQNLRDAHKAHIWKEDRQMGGGLPQYLYTYQGKPEEFTRDLANWEITDQMKAKIKEHSKKTFFAVSGQYDHFDNAKASMWKFKSPIGTGVMFHWPLSQHILDTVGQGFGHAMKIRGATILDDGREALIYQNSYGLEAGDNGMHYVTRDIVNYYANMYGMFMFTDLEKEDVQWMMEHNMKLEDNWLTQMYKLCISFLRSMLLFK